MLWIKRRFWCQLMNRKRILLEILNSGSFFLWYESNDRYLELGEVHILDNVIHNINRAFVA